MHRGIGLALAAALLSTTSALAQARPPASAETSVEARAGSVSHRFVDVGGVKIFYREAGPSDAPTVLLVHGFPTSSYMYRDLISRLATRYHVIAPDLPGFGFSGMPSRTTYKYTFDNLAQTLDGFTKAKGLDRYALYVFDYGAPVGLRLAVAHPERITALISQNGNAYEEGLSEEGWRPVSTYWKTPTAANRKALRKILSVETTQFQYAHGESDASRIPPENALLDQALLDRPGNADIQLDLFGDYQSNVRLYPAFQAYFRKHRPPTLVVWGRNDPFFLPVGAAAFRKDNPDAEVHLLDAGHFALVTRPEEVAGLMMDFLQRRVPTSAAVAR